MHFFYLSAHLFHLWIPQTTTTTARLACKAAMLNSGLEVARDANDGSLWLVNETGNNEEIPARELFGFNIGSFAEVTSGLWGLLFISWFQTFLVEIN